MKITSYFDKYYPNSKLLGYFYNNHFISKVTSNSKEVIPNCVYCHFKGNDNLNYIDEAISKGAKTILITKKCMYNTNKNINIIHIDNPKVELARLNKELYLKKYLKFPQMISVTGTTGKTSVCTLIFEILKKLQKDILLISSDKIHSYYANNYKTYLTNNTTPTNDIIYDYMMQNDTPYDHVIIEISSQGIDDLRVLGIEFDYTIVTNFHKEHMEYHLNENNYLNSKLKLLHSTKQHLIINKDIEHFNKFISESIVPYTTYGINNGDVSGNIIKSNLEETLFYLKILNKKYLVNSKLIGDFNVYNLLSVLTLFKIMGFSLLKVIDIIENINEIKGRMNIIKYQGMYLIVDYAHSKIALENLLAFIKKNVKRKLFVVIGAGGMRDVSNRYFIGDLATKLSDYAIFTEDNSREEKVEDIISDITKNIKSDNYKVIYNRKDAIDYAISISSEDDIVLIVGKGNEDYIINKEKYKFNDLEYIKSLVNIHDE